MFNQINVLPEVKYDYEQRDPNKPVRLNANKIIPNVLVGFYNSHGGDNITSTDKGNKGLPGDPTLGIGAFLKTDYNASTGECLIGANTSNDPDENYYSASLEITFSDTQPVGVYQPMYHSGDTVPFWVGYVGPRTEYYLNLHAIANGRRYCRIKVKEDPNDADTALIEGHVKIFLPCTLTQTGATNSLYAIHGVEPANTQSQEKGMPKSAVKNADIYLDLSINTEAYLFAMITFKGTNPISFEVGDPKDNADIRVEEV